jgi:hypothetical protein
VKRGLFIIAVAVAACISPGCCLAPRSPRGDDVFGLDKLWTVHIEMSAEEWQAMQPVSLFGIAANGDSTSTTQPAAAATRPAHRTTFGYDFPVARATVHFNDQACRDVGIRFKGNASYRVAARSIKKPFKLDFGEFHPGGNFHGLEKLALNNNSEEPWQLNETLSYFVFREAGIPAPRTAYARVYLTVTGKHQRMYLGLYTLVEAVDTAFLQSRFGNADGLLLKPELAQHLPYLGEDWVRYAEPYGARSTISPASGQRLIELARLIALADDATFAQQIGDYIDIDEFLRFTAANVLISNLDSFLLNGHNFYMYLNPADGRFHFIPWDMNLSFGCFLSAGATVDQADLAIERAWPTSNRLIERLMSIAEHRSAYRRHLRSMTQTFFCPREMHQRIDRIQAVIAEAISDEAKTHSAANPPLVNTKASWYPPYPTMKAFISRRVKSVNAQLEGRSSGYVPPQLRIVRRGPLRQASGY